MVSTKTAITGSILSYLLAIVFSWLGGSNTFQVFNVPIFYYCALAVFAIHFIVFVPSFLLKTEHSFDITGSISFLAALFFALVFVPEISLRGLIISSCVGLWTLRLGGFLFYRIKQQGKDGRFDTMKTKFWWYLMTWNLSALWVVISLAPALGAITSLKQVDFSWLGFIGLMIWIFGFLMESIADFQKYQFRKKPENKDQFISHGLWKYSRHPNYVGEVSLWLGIAVIAFPNLESFQNFLLISPVLIYLLLTRISGVNLLESRANIKWANNKSYQAYKEKTPIFFPNFNSIIK